MVVKSNTTSDTLHFIGNLKGISGYNALDCSLPPLDRVQSPPVGRLDGKLSRDVKSCPKPCSDVSSNEGIRSSAGAAPPWHRCEVVEFLDGKIVEIPAGLLMKSGEFYVILQLNGVCHNFDDEG